MYEKASLRGPTSKGKERERGGGGERGDVSPLQRWIKGPEADKGSLRRLPSVSATDVQ